MRDKHSQAISKSCMPPGYTSISRLKEHLNRCHTQPKNQCNRCHETFKSADGLAAHQRSQVTCNVSHARSPPGIMTTDQWDAVRSRKQSNMSTEEKWKSIYRILFPDDSYVPSPYKDERCSTCINTADSRLLDEVEQHLLREIDSPTEGGNNIRARILAVFNSFRQPRNLDPAANSQIHVSSDSQPPEYSLEDIGRRTVSPENILLPTVPVDEWLDDVFPEWLPIQEHQAHQN
ncbi:hypothetical protein F4825DRAFT_404087 [Nemania diffusa]|nr:hypothetical protein F4825DRAFT_404087 [Nemania diffusa]